MGAVEPVAPRELLVAARVADGLVYVVGLAGTVAGAQLFRAGDVALAVVAWVLTFVAGAALRLVVWMARGIAQVMDRSERIEQDVARVLSRPPDPPVDRPDGEDPYRPGRWTGWH